MKIVYKFANGETATVEVPEELVEEMKKLQRDEWASDKRNQRHTTSYDSKLYEGPEYGYEDTPFAEDDIREMAEKIDRLMSDLTIPQRNRVKQLLDGKNMQEIADAEGVKRQTVYESIKAVRAKVKKIWKMP